MDAEKEKGKKNLIVKTWERCQSFGALNKMLSSPSPRKSLRKTKSWDSTIKPSVDEAQKNKCKVAPQGCFSVYVGPQKQRFAVKIELANHPLFKMLLEDAELEYGYNSAGPILLPCDVDLFHKMLAEMSNSGGKNMTPGRKFAKVSGALQLVLRSPARRSMSTDDKIYGAYRVLSPAHMLKMNEF